MKHSIFAVAIKVCLLVAGVTGTSSAIAEEVIDASDPTRVYTFAGGGIKYTDYTNNEEMWEGRITGNLGLSTSDMVLFELGYGKHQGNRVPGSDNGLTNVRARWFHLFDMDYSVTSGYRGLATQVDLQIAGKLKGTDGQNTLSLGVLPAFGLNEKWSLFLPVNLVNTWDKKFENYNGMGISLAPLLSYDPGNWWQGAFVQIWPNYVRFISGELKGEGAGNFDVTVGGQINPTLFWGLTYQKNFDKDLRSFSRDESSELKNDQNLFLSVTSYL